AAVAAGGGAILAAVAAIALVLLFVRRVAVRLGGVTGDVCGAAIELVEIAFLVVLVAVT
ncbi:MAG: adenosylcobinamide-GDP ribazoletransferase, partial [Deltaproteobacteria bacterium]|nr:adenosylcobinamide-GDP ribazoletransferase [Deltaproteobacteria bacterium]